MKFLNFNKVLCISPHPDDVEVGMAGSILKYEDTQFDLLTLTKGGAKGFDGSSEVYDRRGEVKSFWNEMDCSNISVLPSPHDYFEEATEPAWINVIENWYIKSNDYDCIFIPTADDSMFEHRFVSGFGTALCRFSQIGLIEYHSFSTLNTWQPNFFVDVSNEYDEKLKALKHFKSQAGKTYFTKETLDSFHSNFQCNKKGLNIVEQFRIIEAFGGVD